MTVVTNADNKLAVLTEYGLACLHFKQLHLPSIEMLPTNSTLKRTGTAALVLFSLYACRISK